MIGKSGFLLRCIFLRCTAQSNLENYNLANDCCIYSCLMLAKSCFLTFTFSLSFTPVMHTSGGKLSTNIPMLSPRSELDFNSFFPFINITMSSKIYQNIPAYKCAPCILIHKSQLCEWWLLQITNTGTKYTICRHIEIEPDCDWYCAQAHWFLMIKKWRVKYKYVFLYVAALYGCWANKSISHWSLTVIKESLLFISDEHWKWYIYNFSLGFQILLVCLTKYLKEKKKNRGKNSYSLRYVTW